MSAAEEHLGMTDYAVIEFVDAPDAAVIDQILELVAAGTIRILDLAVISKDESGVVALAEVSEVEDLATLHGLEATIAHFVAEADLEVVAEILEPGATALLIVWENLWTLELAHAIRNSGEALVASGRIPAAEILEALVASQA